MAALPQANKRYRSVVTLPLLSGLLPIVVLGSGVLNGIAMLPGDLGPPILLIIKVIAVVSIIVRLRRF